MASGAKTDRAQLRRLLDVLDAGDVLTVTRLDRLARSTRDLLNTLAAITGKKAGFRSLGDTWADTTTSHGRLMLTVLGGLAEFERDLIRARTGEGRARAVARGQSLGPPLQAHPAPAERGDSPPRPWRTAQRDRAQLRKAIASLESGDVLTVTRLDRLARSTRDLLNTLAAITDRKAGFRSLGDAWADTTTSHGRLMLTVLGGLAQFERDLIRARTGEGRARAVARGQRMGRPFKLTDHQKREAIKRRDQGDETLADIGRSYNVSPATISRLTG